jgi:hypothetical protein
LISQNAARLIIASVYSAASEFRQGFEQRMLGLLVVF